MLTKTREIFLVEKVIRREIAQKTRWLENHYTQYLYLRVYYHCFLPEAVDMVNSVTNSNATLFKVKSYLPQVNASLPTSKCLFIELY